MNGFLCEMRSISKTVNDSVILKDVDISVKEKEIHAIIGDNGAGKSVLVRILAGLATKDTGSIYIHNEQLKKMDIQLSKKYGIQIVCQESNLVPYMTVLENIFLGNYPVTPFSKRLDWKTAAKRARDMFQKLNYPINIKSLVGTLGFAQKRMVEIAKAFLSNPAILILDEICAGLNDAERQSFFFELQQLKKKGCGIFYVSQQIQDVMSIADTVTILRDGQIAGALAKSDLSNLKKFMTQQTKGYPKNPQKRTHEVLRVEHLKNDNALKDINFTLHKGEILGIAGLTGSGRSTIANCLFGLEPSARGSIFLKGVEQYIKTPMDAVKLKIGYVQQNALENLVPEMNAIENITLAHMDGVTDKQIIDKRLEAHSSQYYLERLGISADKYMLATKNLSAGEKQKVVLARWLFSGASIILFDEPTDGLDAMSKVDFFNLLNELVAKGISVIHFSCNIEELVGMCHRVLLLKNGIIEKELQGIDITMENIFLYLMTKKPV